MAQPLSLDDVNNAISEVQSQQQSNNQQIPQPAAQSAQASSAPAVSLDDVNKALEEVKGTQESPTQTLLKGTVEYGQNIAKESHHGKSAIAGGLAGAGEGIANLLDIPLNMVGAVQKQITPPEMYNAMEQRGTVVGNDQLSRAYESIPPVKAAKQASPAFYGTGGTLGAMAVPVGGGELAGAKMLQAARSIPGLGHIAGMADALIRMAPGPVGRTIYSTVGNAPLATALATNDLIRTKQPMTPQNLVKAAAPYVAAGTALHALGEVGFGITAARVRKQMAQAQMQPKPVPTATDYAIQPQMKAPKPGEQFREQNRSLITPSQETVTPTMTEQQYQGPERLTPKQAKAEFQAQTRGMVTPKKPEKGPATKALQQSTEQMQVAPEGDANYGNRKTRLKQIEKESVPAEPLEALGEKKAGQAREVLNTLAMKARSINEQEERVRAYAQAVNKLIQEKGAQPGAQLNKEVTLTQEAKAAAEAGVRGYKKVPTRSYVETVPHESAEGISAEEQRKINRLSARADAPTELAKGFAREHDRLQAMNSEYETFREQHDDLLKEAVPYGTHLTEGETTFHHRQNWIDAQGTKSEKAATAIVKQRRTEAAENPENIAHVQDSRYQKMHLKRQYEQSMEMLKGKVPEEEYQAWENGLKYLQRGKTSGTLGVFEPITPALAKATQWGLQKFKEMTPEDGLRLTGTFHSFDIYKKYDPALYAAMQEKVAQLTQVSGGEALPRGEIERQLYKNSQKLDYEDILSGQKGLDKLSMEQREYLTRRNAIIDDMKELLKSRRDALYGKDAKFGAADFFTDKVLGLAIQKDLEQFSGKGFSAPGLNGLFGSIVQGRVQVGEQHLLEALIVNGANDPKTLAGLMKTVKEDPRIWQFTEMYHGNGPLTDAYESAMDSGNPVRRWWAETDRKINGPWMSRAADLIGKENAETLKGLVSNKLPEQFKGQITRAIALTKTAEQMDMKAGELADLLMRDAESFKNLGKNNTLTPQEAVKALEAHVSIANEMYERLGWGAPGYRHLGVFQYFPGAVYLAPFKIQAVNQSAAMNRMWMRSLKALTNKDMDTARLEFRKLMTYTALNATLLGPKAIPKELLAAMSFAAPQFTHNVINTMQNLAWVGKLLQTEPTHIQPAIAPIAQVDPSFLKSGYELYNRMTGQEKEREPKTDEQKEAAVKRQIHNVLFLAALSGFSTVLDSTMGTEEIFNILNHVHEGLKGKRTTWAFSGEPMATFLAKRKEKTNLSENLYHAFVPGERPEDERFIEQMNNNFAAKLHIQWLYPKEFALLDKEAQKYEQMPHVSGLPKQIASTVNAKTKENAQRYPFRSFNWVDAANRLDQGRLHNIQNFLKPKSGDEG
jgi:hypothetical protein